MRISDWSSDVCSSDLSAPMPAPTPGQAGNTHDRRKHGETAFEQRRTEQADTQAGQTREQTRQERAMQRDQHCCHRARTIDRKSVQSGKSVTVRVDLVGRRIMKKKNTKSKQHNL